MAFRGLGRHDQTQQAFLFFWRTPGRVFQQTNGDDAATGNVDGNPDQLRGGQIMHPKVGTIVPQGRAGEGRWRTLRRRLEENRRATASTDNYQPYHKYK